MLEIAFSVAFFTAIVLVLVLFVLGAKAFLVPSGECRVSVNQREPVTARVGQRLLEVLVSAGVFLPSACGGAGTCGLCKARVTSGGGEAGPQELAHMTRKEAARHCRLACQVRILSAMSVEVDETCFGVRTWQCTVTRTHNVATLIREIVLSFPQGEDMEFRAGGFVQLTCPSYQLRFADLDIDEEYRDVWDKLDLWRLEAGSAEMVTRAYSIANQPAQRGQIVLNVRVALPPPAAKGAPAGTVSSWLFSLKPGDTVQVMGPFGHFFVEDTQSEAIFIGGGVGMAPLHAQILDLLECRGTSRKISFWYGARSGRELFYTEVFDELARKHENFEWHVALSAPEPEDAWQGPTGFIHKVLLDDYLGSHRAPEDCEYYICGPPLMVRAVLTTLDNLGVEGESIFYDDFGG